MCAQAVRTVKTKKYIFPRDRASDGLFLVAQDRKSAKKVGAGEGEKSLPLLPFSLPCIFNATVDGQEHSIRTSGDL